MKLKEIIEFLEGKIPESLALDGDEVGFKRHYDLKQDISKILMVEPTMHWQKP